ncbi:MAG: DUF2100 domain-containing protein [Candidatus Helarchaeota archaeon]
MKEAKLSPQNIQNISNIVKNSLELKILLRKKSPHFVLTDNDLLELNKTLTGLEQNIQQIRDSLKIYPIIDRKISLSIKEFKEALIFLTSKNIQKELLKFEIPKTNMLLISSPLSIDDIKKINPKIPDSNLNNLERQINKIWDNINAKIKSTQYKKIYFIKEEKLANELIEKKLTEFFDKKGLEFYVIKWEK